jgi:DNA-binding NarL/FixJ family response regulator
VSDAIRIVLVDDHTLVREGLTGMLRAEPDTRVVAEAATVAEGRRVLATTELDVLVVDVTLPDGSGLQLAREARGRSPRTGIVVLTMHDDDDTLLAALDAGASAYLHKTAAFEEIAEAIRRSSAHPDVFSAAGLAAALRRRSHSDRPHLTPREHDVLVALGEGRSIAQVATTLHLSESTVKTHVAKVYEKLGASNRTQAIMAAVRHGLVTVPDEASAR